jgi:hypothetical protein
MPTPAEIIDRIMRLRAAGKIIRLTPYTAGIVETLLRAALAPPKARHPADALAYRIDEWSADGGKLVGTLAFIGDFEAAKAAWLQFTKSKPNDRLTWRHGTRVIQEQPWTDKFAERA